MSLISEYEQRTSWKYAPIQGTFPTAENLSNKVNHDGSYAVFPGSTVVFRAGRKCTQIIQMMQQILFQGLEGTNMLANPLPASTIHMTLHDLISPEAHLTTAEYDCAVENSIDEAVAIVDEIRRDYAGRKLTLVSDRIVNMVSKSLVLLLRPKTEEDFALLLEMYRRFDEVHSLPYPLTPHITLAYFKPGMLDGDKLEEVVDFAQIDPTNAPVFEFYTESLAAQVFRDMQTYRDIPERICFCCDGGLNRSVMAANIINHLANTRGYRAFGEARSAYPNTQGWSIPAQVWETLEKNGIHADRSFLSARYLTDEEISNFSAFAGISDGALERLMLLSVPEEKNISRFFYGVLDPEYGETTYDQAFRDIYSRAEKYSDSFAKEHAK